MRNFFWVVGCAAILAGSSLGQTETQAKIKADLYKAFDKTNAVLIDCTPGAVTESKGLEPVYLECFRYTTGPEIFRTLWGLAFDGYDVVQPWREKGKTFTRIYKKDALYLYMTIEDKTGRVLLSTKAP